MIVRGAVSGFVLSGGRSSRMGRSKALLPWKSPNADGETMLDHAVARVGQVCASVKICGPQGDADRFSDRQSVPLIPDALPGAGPLGGIVAALEQSTTDWNLFLAVDLPLVPVRFLRSLLARISTAAAAPPLCIVPLLASQPQPLCSVLHRSLAPELRRALEAGNYKLMLAFRTAVAQTAALLSAAPALDLWEIENLTAATVLQPKQWFLNVNTPSDWQQAQRLAGQDLQRPS